MSRVALIIVTFNSERFLLELLLSLKRMKAPDGGMQIIFLDNASADGTVEWLEHWIKEATPSPPYKGGDNPMSPPLRWGESRGGFLFDLKVLRMQKNLGFSAAVNAGIRHPSAQGAEYIALLNPDTVVTEHWLNELICVLDDDPQIASAQSLLLYNQKRDIVQSGGNEIHFLGFGFCSGNGQKFQIPDSRFQILPITYASGAAVLYRRKCLEEIGLFDEDLFMYHDDLDVGWKFLLRGYRNVLVPSSIVYHHYEFSRSIQKYYWMERNRLMILITHYRYRTFLLIFPALLVLESGLTLFSLIRGFFKARMQAYAWLARSSFFLLRKHRLVQRLRQVSDREVLRSFSGTISHQEISNPFVEYAMNPIFTVYLSLVKYLVRW